VSELESELLEELRRVRRELKRINRGEHELVARLTEADRVAIAHKVVDALDERFAAERRAVSEKPPRPAGGPKRRGLLGR